MEKSIILLKCALADLEGVMPEFEPSGDREHPAWKTIEEIKSHLCMNESKCEWFNINEKVPNLTDKDRYGEGETSEIVLGYMGNGIIESVVYCSGSDDSSPYWYYNQDGEICTGISHWMYKPIDDPK